MTGQHRLTAPLHYVQGARSRRRRRPGRSGPRRPATRCPVLVRNDEIGRVPRADVTAHELFRIFLIFGHGHEGVGVQRSCSSDGSAQAALEPETLRLLLHLVPGDRGLQRPTPLGIA